MVEQRQADKRIDEAGAGKKLKRRGILAAAGAVVAGIVAEHTAQPVAAVDPFSVPGTYAVSDSNALWTIENTNMVSATALAIHGITHAPPGLIQGAAVLGDTFGIGATGVFGRGLADLAIGVQGRSASFLGVVGKSDTGIGVYGTISSAGGSGTANTAIKGELPNTVTAPNSVSLHGSNQSVGAGAIGVLGASAGGYGGQFDGGLAPLHLVPAASGTGHPTTGAHTTGELYVDNAGTLFYCTVGGSPGTWVNLSTPAAASGVTSITAPGGTATGAVTLAAGSNVTLTEAGNTITIASTATGPAAGPTLTFLPTPERFVDTRINLGGLQGPVPAGTTHTFPMTGRNGQSGNAALQIPDTATAIVGNLTVVGAAGIPLGSFLTVWPGGTQPTVSNINFGPATVTGAVANSFAVALTSVGGHGALNVFNLSACDYILDVTGYYK